MNTAADRALTYTTEGPEAAPTLVFVHGWPDDSSVWRNQVEALRADYRCVLPTLPNFGDTVDESGGCDFPDIVERLNQTIEELSDEPVTLVIHDWGAYIGYLYEKKYPEKVKTVIAMDVGGHFEPSTMREVAMFVSYQWTLVALWLTGGMIPSLGTSLTRRFARLLKVPQRQVTTLRSRCNYPYFYYWRSTLLPWARSRLLGRYQPKCPILYIYGGDKPLMFHTDLWLEIVERAGGKTACIERGSHWFMETHCDETNQLLSEWLSNKLGRGQVA